MSWNSYLLYNLLFSLGKRLFQRKSEVNWSENPYALETQSSFLDPMFLNQKVTLRRSWKWGTRGAPATSVPTQPPSLLVSAECYVIRKVHSTHKPFLPAMETCDWQTTRQRQSHRERGRKKPQVDIKLHPAKCHLGQQPLVEKSWILNM